MKIFLCASKHVYDQIPPVKAALEALGHEVTPPNSFDEPFKEDEMKTVSAEAHREWKSAMLKLQDEKVKANDAILVLNLEKHGQPNYIGGATFLEIFCAFDAGKKIFLWNSVPEGIFRDELLGMGPTVIHGDLSRIA